jgi:hypothetical protein
MSIDKGLAKSGKRRYQLYYVFDCPSPERVVLTFNHLLAAASIEPASVRLLRHQPILPTRRPLIDIWRADRNGFEGYQSLQDTSKRARLKAPYWAAFIGTDLGQTVFAGLYQVQACRPTDKDMVVPLLNTVCDPNTADCYTLERCAVFEPYIGRLLIDWGGGPSGKRSWIQRADHQDKAVSAILEAQFERAFPGYMAFGESLSGMSTLPPGWISKLMAARGVYLLTCPATGVQYTGSANGSGGFWSRWQDYCKTGHGGNVGLKEVNTAPFRATILQVAGSADTADDILAMEQLWKEKLFSREFGLNRN